MPLIELFHIKIAKNAYGVNDLAIWVKLVVLKDSPVFVVELFIII